MEKDVLVKYLDKYANNKTQINELKKLIAKNQKDETLGKLYNANIQYTKLIAFLERQNKSIVWLITENAV